MELPLLLTALLKKIAFGPFPFTLEGLLGKSDDFPGCVEVFERLDRESGFEGRSNVESIELIQALKG